MCKYTIGLDFGTLSARAVVVDTADGHVLACAEHAYEHGVISGQLPSGQPLPDCFALQDPRDYIKALFTVVPEAVAQSGICSDDVIGIGVDFTASTTLPVLQDGTPLCCLPEFADEPHAYVKLWKHHGAQRQADAMTEAARACKEKWLDAYGGKVSSEWAIPKLLEVLEKAPVVYDRMDEWMEAGDWIVWQLTGKRVRGGGLAGYKSLYDPRHGYPNEAYFAAVHSRFCHVIAEKYASPVLPIGTCAGTLTKNAAMLLGLSTGVYVTVANCDGHVCAPALNVTQPGTMMAIIGTSTGLHLLNKQLVPVSGIFGAVQDGMIPGLVSYESGQSCVGDLFGWFVDHCVPSEYSQCARARNISIHQYLTELAARQAVGQHGLIALDWWNGNRSILSESMLSGLVLGMTLQTKPEDIYRALLEATAFGMRIIIENDRSQGLQINSLVASGGISQKNALAMQIYADVLHLPVHVTATSQGPALGSAIWAAVASGVYSDILTAATRMHAPEKCVYQPNQADSLRYDKLYAAYLSLHDLFGKGQCSQIMKDLLRLKEKAQMDR